MKTIFVVSTNWDHEGGEPIKAFAKEEDAKSFAALCKDYDSREPKITMDGIYANAEWARRHDEWQDKHPSGKASRCDSYIINTIELAAAGEQS